MTSYVDDPFLYLDDEMMDICPKCSIAVLDLVKETNGDRKIPDLSLLRVNVEFDLLNVKRHFCSLAVFEKCLYFKVFHVL